MQPIFTHIRFVDILSNYPLGCSLDSPGDEGATLSGIGEILALEDLEFSIILGKSVDEESIVVQRGPEDGREHACGLYCS